MLGESKFLIPEQKHKKLGDFSYVSLAACDISLSSTQTLICDSSGNSADWGLMKGESPKDK